MTTLAPIPHPPIYPPPRTGPAARGLPLLRASGPACLLRSRPSLSPAPAPTWEELLGRR